MFVLDELCDDYEEIGLITENVTRAGAKCGAHLDRDDVLRALAELIESGLAKAWRLDSTGQAPVGIQGMPSMVEIEDSDCYFLITENGMELQLGEAVGWPFNDNGELRNDWTPPLE